MWELMALNSAMSKEKEAEQATPELEDTELVKQSPPTRVPDEHSSQVYTSEQREQLGTQAMQLGGALEG